MKETMMMMVQNGGMKMILKEMRMILKKYSFDFIVDDE